jgi:23S rRNA (guanosine2251-2'-O)-methyltransferase
MSGKSIFLYGLHAVFAALKNPHRHHKALYLTEKTRDSLAKELKGYTLPPMKIVDAKEIQRMIPATAVHQGIILESFSLEDLSLEEVVERADANATLVILDQVTDPHNVGAILRSCAAFGATALILPEHHSSDLGGIAGKSSSGALEIVPVVKVINLAQSLAYLKKHDFWCYGLDEEGTTTLGRTSLTGRNAFVFGAEGQGIRRLVRESCDDLIRLPTAPEFSTLNVSNTVAVVLYEVMRGSSG